MSAPSSPPKLLLFDLGGVLVRWMGIDALSGLYSHIVDAETIRRVWIESPWVRRFETGGCGPEEFAAGMVEDLKLSVPPKVFLDAFVSWVREPLPGALELLDALAPRFELACLSNTNPGHWKKIRDEFGFGPRFRRAYVSFQIGSMKPDREIYEHVLADSGRAAADILFFDDNIECVEGALRAGMRARAVRGVEGVREVLAELQLHPPGVSPR